MASDEPSYAPFPSLSEWGAGRWDTEVFEEYERLLEESRQAATPEALRAAVRTASRFAAVDTGAIEGLFETDRGFTRTVAVEAAAWEAQLTARGETARRTVEDALRAYEFVLDAATQATPISEMWLRQLHEVICASQETFTVFTAVGPQEQPLPKGEYKTQPNSPTLPAGHVHAYASVLDTPAEMARLIEEFGSAEFTSAHPVIQAAYAHYAFVCVHPFADGNGRVARALASVFLYRRPGVPLVIFADQKADYLDALGEADRGQPLRFINFIAERAIDAIQLVLLHLRTPNAPPLAETLAGLQSSLIGRGGLTHAEIDTLGARLGAIILAEIQSQLAEIPQNPVSHSARSVNGHMVPPPSGYRMRKSKASHIVLNFNTPNPGNASISVHIDVFPALPGNTRSDFLAAADQGYDSLPLQLRDAHPTMTNIAQLKISAWVEGLIQATVNRLRVAAESSLRKSGYLP